MIGRTLSRKMRANFFRTQYSLYLGLFYRVWYYSDIIEWCLENKASSQITESFPSTPFYSSYDHVFFLHVMRMTKNVDTHFNSLSINKLKKYEISIIESRIVRTLLVATMYAGEALS